MAYFKESMLVKERDEQEIMRVESADDPYAKEVVARVFDDANTLVEGARVVAERMAMSLLTPANGHPGISIAFGGATYNYNYDPDGSYATNNFASLSGTSVWSDTTNSDPIADVQTGIQAIEDFDSENITVEQGEGKKTVVVNSAITVVNTMTKLYMKTVIA